MEVAKTKQIIELRADGFTKRGLYSQWGGGGGGRGVTGAPPLHWHALQTSLARQLEQVEPAE